MAAPQGLATFPGVTQITGADFTLSHGISPSVCLIRTVPHTRFIAEVGTLRFGFANLRLDFPEAALNTASLRIDQSGQRWSLQILDRRWKWAFGKIEGRYNVRRADGEIDPDTRKSPQELAKLLLQAMKEQRFDVSAMPDRSRPAVAWDHVTPAPQLAILCEQLGCRIVLNLNNRVVIHRIGRGRDLPANGLELNAGFGWASRRRPDSLIVIAGPRRFQSKLELEAVGEDTDGQIKLIDDLSYTPDNGWDGEISGFFGGVTGTFKQDGKDIENSTLAEKTVWRWYRVKQIAGGGFVPPGFQGVVKSIDKILPLENGLLQTERDASGVKRQLPPIVKGVFWPFGFDHANTEVGALYDGDFQLDTQKGIVKFAKAVTKLANPDAEDFKETEPDLFLTVAYSVKDDKTGMPVRTTVERQLPGRRRGTGPMLLQHPEIIQTTRQTYENDEFLKAVKDNFNDVRIEANHYLDAVTDEFTPASSQDIQYAGLLRISPDGAIQQVSWQVGAAGAFTRASLNSEFNIFVPSFAERRRQERVDQIAADNAMGEEFFRRFNEQQGR